MKLFCVIKKLIEWRKDTSFKVEGLKFGPKKNIDADES